MQTNEPTITRDTQIQRYSTPGRIFIADDGLIQFRIFGEPMPMPKKEFGEYEVFDPKLGRKVKRTAMMTRDHREHKSTDNPKDITKYDFGHKKRWADWVIYCIDWLMIDNGLKPFAKNHPLAWSSAFYLSRSAGNKLPYPSQPPDHDNFDYFLRNALKRTPTKLKKKHGTKVRVEGKYPNGVLFYEDDEIVYHLEPHGKFWATEEEPPGVLIQCMDALLLHERIQRQAYPSKIRMNLFAPEQRPEVREGL